MQRAYLLFTICTFSFKGIPEPSYKHATNSLQLRTLLDNCLLILGEKSDLTHTTVANFSSVWTGNAKPKNVFQNLQSFAKFSKKALMTYIFFIIDLDGTDSEL